MKCSLFQSVVNTIVVTDRSGTTAGDAGNTIDTVDAFVGTSAMFQIQFKKKKQQCTYFSKNIGENCVFPAVGIQITVCS